MTKEKKSLLVTDMEADVDKRIIQGYFSKFTPDPSGDLTRKGTFTKTISDRGPRETDRGTRSKIKLGFNHGPVIGIPVLIREDDTGAYFEGKVDRTPLGDEILARVDSGSLDANSFEYAVIKSDQVKGDKSVTRLLTEVKLYELGPVDYPMHEDAIITGRKSKECIGELCQDLLDLICKKNVDTSGINELKALYEELTARMTVAVEETLSEIKQQPNHEMVLKMLSEFSNKLEQK